MCIKTGGAEKTGEWVSPVWILQWIEENASAASRWHSFLSYEDSTSSK